MKKEKAVICGVGKKYRDYREFLKSQFEIVAFADNHVDQFLDGENIKKILPIKETLKLESDLFIITPIDYKELYAQLIDLEVPREKIQILELMPCLWKKTSWGITCYGQHYEDLVLAGIFGRIKVNKPSYLDLGCNNPFKDSNTALLYINGCRGVNIDANPRVIEDFKLVRPDDVNINCGVAKEKGILPFYMLSEKDGRNSFSEKAILETTGASSARITKIINVPVNTLDYIITNYCNNQFPDFLDCDIEGYDYEVLNSFDFSEQGPKVICVEVTAENIPKFNELLAKRGYFFYLRIGGNNIYVKNRFKRILTKC